MSEELVVALVEQTDEISVNLVEVEPTELVAVLTQGVPEELLVALVEQTDEISVNLVEVEPVSLTVTLIEVERGPPGPPGPPATVSAGSPVFSYDTGGEITRIDYIDNSYKTFTYAAGVLQYIDYFQIAQTVRKTFVRDSSGRLLAITESLIP